MRFSSFHLSRFGHFSGDVLTLPAPKGGAPDLHLVVGGNEAGKSTLRDAITAFLFGIPHRSPYDFLHAKPDMELAADVQHDEGTDLLRRIKANRETLRDSDDSVLPEKRLAALFGGLDRDDYERLFALDHQMLVAGGRRLVENRSDFSQLLFEAASGIADFHDRQSALEARVGELWKRDRRSRTVISQAEKRVKDAEKELKSLTTTGPTYERRRRELRAAVKARDVAAERYAEFEVERRRLERLRAAAAPLARVAEAEKRLAELSDGHTAPPLLPEDARTRLENAQRTLAGLEDSERRDREKLARKRDGLGEIHPDEAVLAAAEDIDALADTAVAVREFPEQIAKRAVEVEGLISRALEVAKQLGWPAADRNALASLLPTAPARRDLRALKERFAALETAESAARDTADQAKEELELIDDALAALPDTLSPPQGLEEAIAEAERLGDVEERGHALREAKEQATRATAVEARRLRPWSGSLEDLEALQPLENEEIDRIVERIQAVQREIEDCERSIAETEATLGEDKAEIERRRGQREIVDREALEAARTDRDRLWDEMRNGNRPVAAAAEDYAGLVQAADTLADRRFDGAQAIAAVEEKEIAVDRLSSRIETLRQARAKAQTGLDEARDDWGARVEAIGLAGMTPAAYREWLAARADVLEAWRRDTAAAEEHDTFLRRVSIAAAALRPALEIDERERDRDGSMDLAALLRHGRERLDSCRSAAREHDRLTRERTAKARQERKAAAALEAAIKNVRAWQEQWTAALAVCNLPENLGIEAAEIALERMDEIERALDEAFRIESRNIATMQRDLDAFEAAASALAAQLLPESAERAAFEIAKDLQGRLVEARGFVQEIERIEADIGALETGIDTLAAEKEAVLSGLAPLFAAAGFEDDRDLDALAAVVETSDARRDAEARLEAATREVQDVSDGVAIDELRRAMEETPAEQRDKRLAELEEAIAEADADRTTSRDAFKEASDALAAITGGDVDGSGASLSEEERQRALSAIVDAADEYIDVLLQARLLRWAIDRYQAENRSPLLELAAPLFQTLTQGSFADLQIDISASPPALLARRADGRLVGLDGLSSGTEDQLYLALRLAATKLRLADAPAMPFVADDLLVNFDDARAEAGFQVLADLGRQTQVLYLTHHEHLIELAHRAAGETINVVRL
jgi:chromosome segregation protein